MFNNLFSTAAAKLSRSSSKNATSNTQTAQPTDEAGSSAMNEEFESLDRFPPRASASSERPRQSVDVRKLSPSPSGSGSIKVSMF